MNATGERNKRKVSRDALWHWYVEQGKTLQQLADWYGVTDATVLYWLRSDGIKTRARKGGMAARKTLRDHPDHFRNAAKKSVDGEKEKGFPNIAKGRESLKNNPPTRRRSRKCLAKLKTCRMCECKFAVSTCSPASAFCGLECKTDHRQALKWRPRATAEEGAAR